VAGESRREGEAAVGGGCFLIHAVKIFFKKFQTSREDPFPTGCRASALARINFVYFAIIDACNLVYF
jgi:hypothetical protein